MKFEHQMTYDAPPEAVHAMLAEPAFREKVCRAMGTLRQHAERRPGTDGAELTMVIDQVQAAQGIPSFATKFVGEEIQIVQTEHWGGAQGGRFEVVIPGKPGHMRGTMTLAERGRGVLETVEGEIKVSIPLLGGKLEGLIADMLGKALATENRVGREWLAGRR